MRGDRPPEDVNLLQAGTQTGLDDLGNVKVTATVEADRVDMLNDSADADFIESGGGDDNGRYRNAHRGVQRRRSQRVPRARPW